MLMVRDMTTDAYVKLTHAVKRSIPDIACQMNIRLSDGGIDELTDDIVFAMDQATAASIYVRQEKVATPRLTKLIVRHLLAYAESNPSVSEGGRLVEGGFEVLDA